MHISYYSLEMTVNYSMRLAPFILRMNGVCFMNDSLFRGVVYRQYVRFGCVKTGFDSRHPDTNSPALLYVEFFLDPLFRAALEFLLRLLRLRRKRYERFVRKRVQLRDARG